MDPRYVPTLGRQPATRPESCQYHSNKTPASIELTACQQDQNGGPPPTINSGSNPPEEKAVYLLQWAALVQANDQHGNFDPVKAQLLIRNDVLPRDVADAFGAEADVVLHKGRGTWSDVSETARLRAVPKPGKKRKRTTNKNKEENIQEEHI